MSHKTQHDLHGKRRDLFQSTAPTLHARQAVQPHANRTSPYFSEQQSSIQRSLERTRNLLSQNLDRTAHSMITLKSSSDTLQRTYSTHQTFGDSLSQSKGLLHRIKMAEHLEHYLTLASFIFFVLVVLYVEESRVGILRFAITSIMQLVAVMLGISSWVFPASEIADLQVGE